jgi:glutathione synthase/RimK-type ligase-like ATP-grasp enzyme
MGAKLEIFKPPQNQESRYRDRRGSEGRVTLTRERRVFVLTNQHDFAADGVVDLLKSSGTDVVRVNSDDLSVLPDWSPGEPASANSTVWWRQFLPEPTPASTVEELDDRLVVAEQWRSWISVFDDPGGYWMNPLWAARLAENKIVQLRTAKTCGFSVPATLVTNNAASAATFAAQVGQCVVKSLRAGYFGYSDQSFMFTRLLTPDIIALRSEWQVQPLVVQAQIKPRIDIRVFVVHHQVEAAVSTMAPLDAIDWRTASSEAHWGLCPLPPALVKASEQYVELLNLEYCAIDLASDGHDVWFLEGNQAGEFAFVDRPLDLGITAAIARALSTAASR